MLIAFLIGIAPAFSAEPCTKVGVIAEFQRPNLTSPQPFGLEILEGVRDAIAQLPKGSCVEQVKLDFGSSISNIGDVIRNASKKDGIYLFIGLGTSSQALSAVPALQETRSLLISPTASAEELVGVRNRVVMLFPRNRDLAAGIAQETYRRGARRADIIAASNIPYSMDIAKQFEAAFRRLGGVIGAKVEIRGGSLELSPAHLKAIRDSGSSHLFLPLFELDVARAISALHFNKINKSYVGTDSWGTTSSVILKLTEKLAFKAFVPLIYSPDHPSELNQAFVARYQERNQGKLPSDLAAFSFNGLGIFSRMLGSCTEEIIRNAPDVCLNKILPLRGLQGVTRKGEALTTLNPRFTFKDL